MKTVILSDLHNRRVAVMDLFEKLGLIDADGERVDGFRVISLGDIVSLGYGEVEAGFFEWVWPFIDVALVGNHEYPVFNDDRMVVFSGWSNRDVDAQGLVLDSFVSGDKWKAAIHVGEWLLTHAGLHPSLLDDLADVDGAVPGTAEGVAWLLRERFDDYRLNGFGKSERLPLFDGISYARGGYDRFGGIFWNDVTDLCDAYRGKVGSLPQICGHSSYAESLGGYPRFHEDLWCIDTRGSVNALVTEDDGASFEFVRSDYDYSYGSGRRVNNYSKVR